MKKITLNPHDRFFRYAMNNIDVARGLLKNNLSPSLVQRIDWDSLLLASGDFVDEEFQHRHSDVIYSCRLVNKE